MRTDKESEDVLDKFNPDMNLSKNILDTQCNLWLIPLAAGCFGSIPLSIQAIAAGGLQQRLFHSTVQHGCAALCTMKKNQWYFSSLLNRQG